MATDLTRQNGAVLGALYREDPEIPQRLVQEKFQERKNVEDGREEEDIFEEDEYVDRRR